MSLAGRPSQRAALEDALVKHASALFYVAMRASSLEGERPNAKIVDCERCGEELVTTPYVLAEKRALAHLHGQELIVICTECVAENVAERGVPAIGLMPTPDEAAAAERFNRGAP